MSEKDTLRDALDSTNSLFEAAEMYVRDRFGTTPLVATIMDLGFLVGCSFMAYFMWHSTPYLGRLVSVGFAYFALVSLLELIHRYKWW